MTRSLGVEALPFLSPALVLGFAVSLVVLFMLVGMLVREYRASARSDELT